MDRKDKRTRHKGYDWQITVEHMLIKIWLLSVVFLLDRDNVCKYNVCKYNVVMKKFVNRQSELAALEREFGRSEASFVVLYGRRRIGKTELIVKFLQSHESCVYFLATQESEAQNLITFKNLVADHTGNYLLKRAEVEWEQVFEIFVQHKPNQKQIVVIDEFQYIGMSNRAFGSIMQKIWDRLLKDKNIMLILCGSLVGLMTTQVLDYGSPLYGRRTSQIKLKQIAFEHYNQFFDDVRSSSELVEFYAITGGVPKYIELMAKHRDIFVSIEESVLNRASFLFEEPFFLLQNEVHEIGSYFSLIKTIAAGNRKLGDIAANLGVPQTHLTRYLKVLIDLDIVLRETPITDAAPEKSKNGLYKIKDNFIAFWFGFVYPYYSYLEREETGYVMKKIKQGFVQNFVSFVYEDICIEKMWRLSADGVFGCYFDKVGRHWGKNIGEIDIVALDTVDKNILVGECKYSANPKGMGVLYDLQSKGQALARTIGNKSVGYVIFSKSGFLDELVAESQKRDDLFLYDSV